MAFLNTVIVVAFTPLAILGLRWLSRKIGSVLPGKRFREFMTKERGYYARPNLPSLRSGLK